MVKPPRNVFELVRRYVPDWTPRVIFDVGANVGQSATAYARHFPQARIHAFEPVPASYDRLVKATRDIPRIATHEMALGKANETVPMKVQGTATTNKLVAGARLSDEGVIKVQVRPGADLFRELELDGIDFLKIDTEGHDYEVLIGFLPIIEKIDLIQVEASMNPHNRTHVPLRLFEDLLWYHGFYLFRIFDQAMEHQRGGQAILRRSNPVFINGHHLDLERIS